MKIEHPAICTKDHEIDISKFYLYREYNYPYSHSLIFSAIGVIKKCELRSVKIFLEFIPKFIIKGNQDALELGEISVYQSNDVDSIWSISDVPEGITSEDFPLLYFDYEITLDYEQEHLLSGKLTSSILESHQLIEELNPLIHEISETLMKYKILTYDFQQLITNASAYCISLLKEACLMNEEGLINRYSIWLRFALIKALIRKDREIASGLEKYPYHEEQIDEFIKELKHMSA